MSNRFHNKWHRVNHHSIKSPNDYPDQGWDPIASEQYPFSGDFYMAGGSGWGLHADSINVDEISARSPGPVKINNNLSVTGDLTLTGGNFYDYGDFIAVNAKVQTISAGVSGVIDGNLKVGGEGTFLGGIDVRDHFNYTGDFVVNGDLTVTGNTDLESDLNVTGDISVKFNGTSAAVETTDNGQVYVYGIGNYDGVDSTTAVDLKTVVGGKVDKVSSATSGNFAGLDANGNLIDSGNKASDFATTADATLTERSGFTDWVIEKTPSTIDFFGPEFSDPGVGYNEWCCTINGIGPITSDINATNPNALRLEFHRDDFGSVVCAREAKTGYKLGNRFNNDKPLAKDSDLQSHANNSTIHVTSADKENWNDKIGPMESITWSQLKAKRDGGTLVPGAFYRITDYVATTVQAATQSANKPFDIIVRADSANQLNENAKAIKNASDNSYFTNSKLESWELKYCLDNDTNRFAWADLTNGKGVVYYLKDEFGNECPYDFKGIKFKRWAITDITSTKLDSDSVDSLKSSFVYDSSSLYYAYKSSNISVDGTIFVVDANESAFYFTFDVGDSSDSSLSSSNSVYGNKIGQYINSDKLTLNSIVFLGSGCFANTFGSGCSYNTFGGGCSYNVFGGGCSSNTFGGGCSYNVFGGDCSSNTFGGGCSYNVFGGDCFSNTFGGGCSYNVFGGDCFSNTFGSYCFANTFGGGCSSNTFGSDCYYNTFGSDCSSNVFGSGCSSNTFDGSCYSNAFGTDCTFNTFGNGCNSNTFGLSSSTALGYYQNIKFENGINSVNLYCDQTLDYSSMYQNITILHGVNNKTITDHNVNQVFHTMYQPANSQVVSV